MADKDAKFKSKVAQEAFIQLCHVASLERDRILGEISGNKGHSEYEKAALKINLAQAYQGMLARAYDTAMDIEIKGMALHAQVAHVFSGSDA